MIEVEGIILTSQDYGETSKIINVITKQYGIIGMIVKGCKNIKSPLRSTTDKPTYGKFYIYYKKDKLSTLTNVDIIDNFKNIKKDIIKISFATYLLELTGQVLKHSLNFEIFDLFISALIKINENYDPLVIMNILELKYLDYLGVMPILDKCVKCGNTAIKTLSSDIGGFICSKCYTNQKLVSSKTIKLIRMYYYVDIAKITKLEVSKEAKKEINVFLNDYYDRYTGLYLKSKNFINNLNKLEI